MDFEYKIENGEVTITGYNIKSVTEIIIPEIIDGYPVRHITYWGFSRCESLKEVTIPNTVTDIGNGCFMFCDELTYINGIKIKNNTCVINYKFIYNRQRTYNIIYEIGCDYIVDYGYFIDNQFLRGNFKDKEKF